jgi:hypothetical protein
MKKIVIAALLGLFAANMAFACPKGTHLEGGTGPNHKGGKCVAVASADAKAADVKASEAKAPKANTPDAKTVCATQAAEKKLAGAAKNSFMKKCEKDTVAK